MTAEEKQRELQGIAEEVRNLEESPLYEYRQENDFSAVPGEGDPDAEIMFIGEAPGKQEAQSGRPFVGSAGRVLDGLLESIGLGRERVFITNIVKDRPPQNRDPHKDEIELYAPFLERQIEIIQPAVIATLGRFAMEYILERLNVPGVEGKKISEIHGQIFHGEAPCGEVAVVPLYHPAAGFYNTDVKNALEEDIKVLKQFVDGR
ncbi:MAG: uracil-DNA glycosylase family protein [Anaerolineales bacterium]